MVKLNPPIRTLALPAAQSEDRDARIVIPIRRAAILFERLRLKRKRIDVLPTARELDAFDGLNVRF